MLVITGPNFSGKSVYLKQVATIVYLAHVGSFVPAQHATIGLTDAILTRLTARDTVSRFQSAFMSDMQQTAMALQTATNRSLVLLDELGKGTDTSDGIGIVTGVYKHLLTLGKRRPKVLAATHLHEIFETQHLANASHLVFAHMEIQADTNPYAERGTITYLYNLKKGRCTSSHGSTCALRNGIDAYIIERSEVLSGLHAKGEDLVTACATISKKEEEQLQDAEEGVRDFLEQDLKISSGEPQCNALNEARGLVSNQESIQ